MSVTRTPHPPQLSPRGVPAVGKLVQGLQRIFSAVPHGDSGAAPALRLRVQCSRCAEVIATRIDKANDLLCEYPEEMPEDETPHPIGYTLHKEFVGRQCQNLVHLTMHFNENRRATRHEIEGGTLVGYEDCQ